MANKTVETVEGMKVTFWQIPGGRWVFAGSRNAGGYLTRKDAEVEAKAQVQNRAQGTLNTEEVPTKVHRATWKTEIDAVAWKY